MELEIKRLTKDLKEDYLFLFDNMVHKENPDWAKCYCNDYHFLGDVETCTREVSRDMIINRINDGGLSGYLVFESNNPVAWCNTNDRSNYQRLMRDYDLIDNPKDKVCSVVCFLVDPKFRRKGITQKIIERVIADFSNTDYDYIEVYPKKGDANTSNFNGPLELYKRNDFKLHKKYENYLVMRKKLK